MLLNSGVGLILEGETMSRKRKMGEFDIDIYFSEQVSPINGIYHISVMRKCSEKNRCIN
jgi:hypothetical protein